MDYTSLGILIMTIGTGFITLMVNLIWGRKYSRLKKQELDQQKSIISMKDSQILLTNQELDNMKADFIREKELLEQRVKYFQDLGSKVVIENNREVIKELHEIIESLKKKLKNIKVDVEKRKNKIKELKIKINNNDKVFSDLKAEIESKSEVISRIESYIAKMENFYDYKVYLANNPEFDTPSEYTKIFGGLKAIISNGDENEIANMLEESQLANLGVPTDRSLEYKN